MVDTGDRSTEGLRCRKQLGPGVCRVGIAEAEVNVRGGECLDGIQVGHVDGPEQDTDGVGGAALLGDHHRLPCRTALSAMGLLPALK
jgi:hypothetical protein